jgi:hypothetical protein
MFQEQRPKMDPTGYKYQDQENFANAYLKDSNHSSQVALHQNNTNQGVQANFTRNLSPPDAKDG